MATEIVFPDQPAFKIRDYIKFLYSRVPAEQIKSDSTGNLFTFSGSLKLDVRNVREPKRSDLARALEIAKQIGFDLDGMHLDFTQTDLEIINVPVADLKNWMALWGTLPEITEFKNYTGNKIKLPTPGYLVYDDENATAAWFIRQARGPLSDRNLITTVDFERALGYTDRRHLTLSRLDPKEQSTFLATLRSGQRLHANLLVIPFQKEATSLRVALHELTEGELILDKLIVIPQSELRKKISCLGGLE